MTTKDIQTYVVSGNMQPLNSVFPIEVRNFAALVINLRNTGASSLAAGNFAYEASVDSTDGTDGTWAPVQGSRPARAGELLAAEVSPAVAAGTIQQHWTTIAVAPYTWFRVRTTVAGSAGAVPVFTVGLTSDPLAVTVTGQMHMTAEPSNAIFAPQTTFYNSAASTNLNTVRNTAATVGGLQLSNTGAATRYVKLYNKASNPTLASDVPVMVFVLPAGSDRNVNFGNKGARFGTGLALAITGGAGDTDATAVGAGEVKVAVAWY